MPVAFGDSVAENEGYPESAIAAPNTPIRTRVVVDLQIYTDYTFILSRLGYLVYV